MASRASARDEEISCVYENDFYVVNAVKVIKGCILDKKNLIYRETGKTVFSLIIDIIFNKG
ncbi:FmdE family protein [Clostridium tyrobutyricum]|uniref:FmdE family protein n=1 Tax=Clostridium tyrobutyricum TaxID=1519 RepID=UPI00242B6298|nr:FmdE family protein [Clostridium tyrobutyricum]